MAKPIEGKPARHKTGWIVVVQWTNEQGKRKKQRLYAPTKAEAMALRAKALADLESGVDPDFKRATFSNFAEWYTTNYLFPAEYKDGRKVAGRRSLRSALPALKHLVAFFGQQKLKHIRYSDLEKYKSTRLKEPHQRNPTKTVAIATVNRELSLLRRMFNVAFRQGWISRSPFTQGDTLISVADERKRTRVLLPDEERRLLAACEGEDRAHLKPLLIAAIDTGCRQGELFRLEWKDVNFTARTITVQAANTKTLTARTVPMTARLASELLEESKRGGGASTLVFPFKSVKRSFATACRLAGIADLRFHDLRHTAGTRLERLGLSLTQVGQILGHTQHQTTLRYINLTSDLVDQAGRLLNQWNEQSESETDWKC